MKITLKMKQIKHFNTYCIQIYDSFIFASKNKKQKYNNLWQKLVTVSSINMNEEKKENNDINVMDLPDYDDYDYSSDESMDDNDNDNNNNNTLETFISMSDKWKWNKQVI